MKTAKLLPSIHTIHEFRGTARRCGEEYGRSQADWIRCFYAMETPPDPWRVRYAKRCWNHLRGWMPPITEWILGMAHGSGLSPEELTLLLLHEEIVHTKPCTAVGATREGTRDGHAIIGQNWDWNPRLYPWSSLLRARTDSMPRTLTYAYPGLWACAGVNEHGLSLVWTGTGYLPKIRPRDGIPTYALLAGIFTRHTCAEVIALCRRTRIAGSFIFFVADANGEVIVIESLNGDLEIERCKDVIDRANHYESERIVRLSGQKLPRDSYKVTTVNRTNRATAWMRKHNGRVDRHVVEGILRSHLPRPGMSICVHPVPGNNHCGITVDSFYALPSKREFWIARGLQCRHRYERYVA